MKLTRRLRYGLRAIGVVVVVLAGLQLANVLLRIGTVDRSSLAVPQSVRDLSRFHVQAGGFQVVVVIEQDVTWAPSASAGERVTFVAVGTVDACADVDGRRW